MMGDVKIDGWMELKWYVEWITWKDARSKCKFNSGFSTTFKLKKGEKKNMQIEIKERKELQFEEIF